MSAEIFLLSGVAFRLSPPIGGLLVRAAVLFELHYRSSSLHFVCSFVLLFLFSKVDQLPSISHSSSHRQWFATNCRLLLYLCLSFGEALHSQGYTPKKCCEFSCLLTTTLVLGTTQWAKTVSQWTHPEWFVLMKNRTVKTATQVYKSYPKKTHGSFYSLRIWIFVFSVDLCLVALSDAFVIRINVISKSCFCSATSSPATTNLLVHNCFLSMWHNRFLIATTTTTTFRLLVRAHWVGVWSPISVSISLTPAYVANSLARGWWTEARVTQSILLWVITHTHDVD